MCFNLFGWLHDDMNAATKAARLWWPDAPGQVIGVHFEWSPGRRDPEYLGNQSAFDMAFELDLGNNQFGVIGVETKYHEHAEREKPPSDKAFERYKQVANNAKIFKENAISEISGTDLQQIWQDHLLALSMLQHPSKKWKWAKFVLIYPEKNPSYRIAAVRYDKLLLEPATPNSSKTFESKTLESILNVDALPMNATEAFRERYIF